MTVYISLDETLVNRINIVIEKYNNFLLPVEIVLGKFKGVFVKDIGRESYDILYKFMKNADGYSYGTRDQISISNSIENFDIDLTQYNIRIQPVKSHYSIGGVTHEFKSENPKPHTVKMFNHPDGSFQTSIFFKPFKYTITQLFQPLKTVFKPIIKTDYLISYTERRQVTESYNILVKKKGKTPNIIFNKPYNLTREHIHEILNPSNGYILFPKLDGVRYFLYFVDSSCYLLNYTDFLKLSDSEDGDIDNTLLDGEFINGVYYPFDVLYWRGEDVRRRSRSDRLNCLKTLNTTFNMIVIPPEKDIKTGLEKYFKNPDQSTPLDGVIITCNFSPYLNNKTFKYKPHEEQLIDFIVKWNDSKKIELYVKDYNNTLSPFRGSDKNPYYVGGDKGYVKLDKCSSSKIDILRKGGVVEFKWDENEKCFFPVRNRTDKLNPNFVEVAKTIWDEIKDPVEISFDSDIYTYIHSPISDRLILLENTFHDIFDSILHSGSPQYRDLNPEKKKSFVKSLRQNFINNPKFEDWLNLDDGRIAFNAYKKELVENFIKIYNTSTVESPRLKNNIYYDIFRKRPIELFINTIIPEMVENFQTDKTLPKIPTVFKSNHFKDGEKKHEKYATAIDLLFNEISNFSIRSSYKKFIGKICMSEKLEQDIIDYISLIFKKDIYVLDKNTGLVTVKTSSIKNAKSILISYSTEENRFWSIGRVKGGFEGVESDFLPDDEMVIKLRG